MNESVNCYLRVLNDCRIREETDELYDEFIDELYKLARRDFEQDNPYGEMLLN